jgi:hypothetical protein
VDKQKFETPNLTAENMAKCAELFPGVVADRKRESRHAVFRDSSFTSSPEKINVAETIKLLAANTNVRVI